MRPFEERHSPRNPFTTRDERLTGSPTPAKVEVSMASVETRPPMLP